MPWTPPSGNTTAFDVDAPRARSPSAQLRDAARGALIGVAVGDALGRPGEGLRPTEIRRRYVSLTDYHPWRGWRGGPVGTVTDDTQMTMCVAESVAAHGRIVPEDLTRRFVDWLPIGRGKGRTCTEAVVRLRSGIHWSRSGLPSAGNGAAMRVAPVGLRHFTDRPLLQRDATTSAVITHADQMAIASAVAQATAVARCLVTEPGHFDIDRFMSDVVSAVAGIPDPGAFERRPGSARRRVRLLDRLRELPDMLDLSPSRAFSYLHNGAFVLESLPAAWWCFLRYPDDPERAIVTAADGGYDADTVASMAGALAGAYHGGICVPLALVARTRVPSRIERPGRRHHLLGRPSPRNPLRTMRRDARHG